MRIPAKSSLISRQIYVSNQSEPRCTAVRLISKMRALVVPSWKNNNKPRTNVDQFIRLYSQYRLNSQSFLGFVVSQFLQSLFLISCLRRMYQVKRFLWCHLSNTFIFMSSLVNFLCSTLVAPRISTHSSRVTNRVAFRRNWAILIQRLIGRHVEAIFAWTYATWRNTAHGQYWNKLS